MKQSVQKRIEVITDALAQKGAKIVVEFEARNLPVSDESKTGADIGLQIRIRTPAYTAIKGILVQAKRMDATRHYPELPGRGESQAKKMLRITPASFFMLYNFGAQADLLKMVQLPAGLICPVDGAIPLGKNAGIPANCPFWADSEDGIWDLGIAIVPASRILALSAGSLQGGTPFPHDASTIMGCALPLGVFLVDLVASCFVGDVRKKVVRITTSPRKRAQLYQYTGLAPEWDDFTIRHYIDISIDSQASKDERVG
jgi:hypothetical protein